MEDIRQIIRDIPDFPKPGVVFKDITPLLSSAPLFKRTIDLMAERYQGRGVDTILGIESRGFIIGAALAYTMGAGFWIVRKPGKLPYETHSTSYELEYGSDALEIHRDGLWPGSRVLIVDDLLATGGTAAAAAALVLQLSAEVIEFAFVIELAFLGGRERLNPRRVFSIIQYDTE
ncbi:MAG: adenine phosphoribosyltransferase [Candidatus Binatia bacterium]